MSSAARGLVPKLVLQQLLVGAMTAGVVVALSQRLLLLEPRVVEGSLGLIAWGGSAIFALVLLATFVVVYPVRHVLRDLATGVMTQPGASILGLYAVPARLVTIVVVGTLAICSLSLLPPLRPSTNDVYTQVELVVLSATIVSVAALPLYVMMRASVARVVEAVPVATAREAIELLEAGSRGSKSPSAERRVRQRLFAAVAAPVLFVALGASLLVHAHVRAFDVSSREDDATQLARGMLDVVGGSTVGREQAIEQAREHMFFPEVWPEEEKLSVVHDEKGEARLTLPLGKGHAVVRFEAAPLSTSIGFYVLLAFVATALAGFLGQRLGKAFASDVALATREVRAMGAADFIHGTRISGDALFSSINALLHAIEQLAGIFREFAAAQQRAIDARAATERMRGLFLASMSHDLKAPLNAILGFAGLVARGELTDGQRESITIIEQRGRELLYLIDTILDAARVEAGQLSVVPEWTKVGDVVMSAVTDARELVAGMDVQIVGEIQPGVPRLLVDPPRVTQALTAIILVAARFSDQGRVHVRATISDDGERLRIDVEASGRGIAAQERERLFEAFKFADRARRHGSLGLGPSLARSLLEMHGGTIDVEATEGGGTVFRVWLPTEWMATQRQSVPPPSAR